MADDLVFKELTRHLNRRGPATTAPDLLTMNRKELDRAYEVRRAWQEWLNRRSQRASLNGEKRASSRNGTKL